MTITRRDGESLVEFAKRKLAAEGKVLPEVDPEMGTTKPMAPGFEQFVPEVEYEASPERLEMDRIIGDLGILDAYSKWCGKMQPKIGKRRESIMVSCPNPSHPDRNPSAWINLDKGDGGVGTCPQCGGFDKYDIAAWGLGFDVPGYKEKTEYPELRKQMAEQLGYVVVESGKDVWLEAPTEPPAENAGKPETTESRTESPAPAATGGESQALSGSASDDPPVNSADDEDDEDEDGDGNDLILEEESQEILKAQFDWRGLSCIQPNTFLHEWLETTSRSYEPEEYYLWEGLMAIGHALGNEVHLQDAPRIRGNLMTCLVGTTGAGKSISMRYYNQLLREALPFDPQTATGVMDASGAGSGEALLDIFNWVITDPNTGVAETLPVNASYRENELANFSKKISRNGNNMREIMMDMYDSETEVSARSRGSGIVTARDHYMQFITSTQPDAVGDLLSQNDAAAGFLNRFVFVFGKGKTRPAIGGIELDLRQSAKHLRIIRAWASSHDTIGWRDQDAIDLFTDFYHDRIEPLGNASGNWMVSRIPLTAKKILMLLAANDRDTSIRAQHVQALIDMWPYLLQCYGVVERKITTGSDQIEACAEAVVNYLKNRPNKKITMRVLAKQSAAKKFTTQTRMRAVQLLVATGELEETFKRGQDRAVKYSYRPSNVTKTGLASVTPIK